MVMANTKAADHIPPVSFKKSILLGLACVVAFLFGALSYGQEADATNKGPYPTAGMYNMSYQSGYKGEIRFAARLSACSNQGIFDAFTQIEQTTDNTSELTRFPDGIQHTMSCYLEQQPFFGGDYDSCTTGDCPFEDFSYFNGSNDWDVYLWLDNNQESFRQSNNTFIGARVRNRQASAAFCTALASISECGRRYVIQWNTTKYPLSNTGNVTKLLVHELGHTHGLNDIRIPGVVSKMNYSYDYFPYVGFSTYDRNDISDVYERETSCSATLADFYGHKGRVLEVGMGIHKLRRSRYDIDGASLNNKVSSLKVHGGPLCRVKICDATSGDQSVGFGCRTYNAQESQDLFGVQQGHFFTNATSRVIVFSH